MESTLPPPKNTNIAPEHGFLEYDRCSWGPAVFFRGYSLLLNSTTGGADLQSISLEKRRILHGLTAQAGVSSVFFFPSKFPLCFFLGGETVGTSLGRDPSYRNFGEGNLLRHQLTGLQSRRHMEILQPLLIARPELPIEFFFLGGGCLWIGKFCGKNLGSS